MPNFTYPRIGLDPRRQPQPPRPLPAQASAQGPMLNDKQRMMAKQAQTQAQAPQQSLGDMEQNRMKAQQDQAANMARGPIQSRPAPRQPQRGGMIQQFKSALQRKLGR